MPVSDINKSSHSSCYGGPCPGTEGGRLKTPNYPAPYPARQSIKYELETNYGARIRLKFNSFDLEQSAMCQYDNVKLAAPS